jgi:hypothetical protein
VTSPTCPSCGQPRVSRFCGTCGERAVDPDELSIQRFVRALAEELIPGLDIEEDQPVKRMGGRIYRTVYTLFRHPGQLTADYIAGRRRLYLKPVQVFLTISVVFFLFGHNYFQYNLGEYEYIPGFGETHAVIAAEVARSGLPPEEYGQRFDARLESQKKAIIALIIPVFALGFLPLYRRRRYGEHLVFSIHFFALLLLFMVTVMKVVFYLMLVTARWITARAPELSDDLQAVLNSEWLLLLLIYVPMLIYLVIALRRVYGGTTLVTLFKTFPLLAWHIATIVFVFRSGLFFTTFYSLKWFD